MRSLPLSGMESDPSAELVIEDLDHASPHSRAFFTLCWAEHETYHDDVAEPGSLQAR